MKRKSPPYTKTTNGLTNGMLVRFNCDAARMDLVYPDHKLGTTYRVGGIIPAIRSSSRKDEVNLRDAETDERLGIVTAADLIEVTP